MSNEKKITRINNIFTKCKTNVAVYRRVSTTHAAEIESLSNQIEHSVDILEAVAQAES